MKTKEKYLPKEPLFLAIQYWQYFCGETYFQIELPLHYTSLGPPKAVLLTLPRRCVNSLTMLAGVFERRGRSFFR